MVIKNINFHTLIHRCIFQFLYFFFLNKLSFWSLRFGHFCHFSPKLKSLKSGSLWFHFYCHFGPKIKSPLIWLLKSDYFVFYFRGKIVHLNLL
ncbi:hypothetical protein Hanom_Chr16g01465871 [Helianthus anomalus]